MLQLHSILSGMWCLDSVRALDYLPLVASFIKGEATGERQRVQTSLQSSEVRHDTLIAPICGTENIAYRVGYAYGEWYPEEISDPAVAIITITGAITKHASCENIGIEKYADLLHRCYANESIKGIILVIDTPGGEAYAMITMVEVIRARNKPVSAYVSDSCFSAGMGIATACDAIVLNHEFARVGSIGTMMTIVDQREYFEKQGINLIELYAKASKDKNQDYRDILDGNTDAAVARLDQINDFFLSAVETGRGDRLIKDRSVWGTGKTFSSQEALDMGLVDAVDTLIHVIDYFSY